MSRQFTSRDRCGGAAIRSRTHSLHGIDFTRDRRVRSARHVMGSTLAMKLCLILGVFFAWTPFCGAVPLQVVSVVDPAQTPAGGSGDSWESVLSADGRFVLFASAANNLCLTTNGNPIPLRFPPRLNVFLRDRTNG